MKKFVTLLAVLATVVGTGAAGFSSLGHSRDADFASSLCAWYFVLEDDGLGGQPMAHNAPGQGCTTGRLLQIVLKPTQSLGSDVHFDADHLSPVEAVTRGEIKGLF